MRLQKESPLFLCSRELSGQVSISCMGILQSVGRNQHEPCPVYINGSALWSVYNQSSHWIPGSLSPDVDVTMENGILINELRALNQTSVGVPSSGGSCFCGPLSTLCEDWCRRTRRTAHLVSFWEIPVTPVTGDSRLETYSLYVSRGVFLSA